jgi:hypothetical protein
LAIFQALGEGRVLSGNARYRTGTNAVVQRWLQEFACPRENISSVKHSGILSTLSIRFRQENRYDPDAL